MSLPINIEELLHGHVVEWERIECKKGWNPEDILHTIVAFANDINNWGGGYILLGISEAQGVIQLPPDGLELAQVDVIQRQLLALSHKIQPYYAPVPQPYTSDGKHILVLWVPGGDNRPYKGPTTLGEKGQNRYYVRRGSSTVLANLQEEQLLLEMAKRIPFDDRVNHQADIGDFSFAIIREFLEEIKSDLAFDAARMPTGELALQMRIANGPSERLLPLNVGLLFFSENPGKYFPGAKTEVVRYSDNTGKEFSEKIFTGPLHLQLRSVLSYIQTNIIKENVAKTSNRAEANRVFNYPFAAIEEVIANAFYHRSYELPNTIEINFHPDKMEVLSFPGPLPPVTKAVLKQQRIVARDYRNRRLGDILKELKLTEGRSTGFPTIYSSMKNNGSPKPIFETDDNYAYFLATLPIQSSFLEVPEVVPEIQLQILLYCFKPKKRADILKHIGYANHSKNYKRYIVSLIEKGWLGYNQPDSVRSPSQEYVTTTEGKAVLG